MYFRHMLWYVNRFGAVRVTKEVEVLVLRPNTYLWLSEGAAGALVRHS